jgi:hypothetical protein
MAQRAERNGLLVAEILCCVLAVSAAGCNGGGDSSTSANAPASTSALSISGTPSAQARVGQAYSFQPTVNSSGGTVGFSIQNKPGWATFSVATGQLTGTPSSSDVGTYSNVDISATNGVSTASLPSFSLTVAKNGTVTLSWNVPTTNTNGSPLTDLSGYKIDYGTSSSTLNQSISVSNPTTTAYTLQNLASGTWYFAIAAVTSDGMHSALSNVVSTTL